MIDLFYAEHILISGSRTFTDYALLCETMDKLTKKFTSLVVLSGAAKGADELGERWAFSWWWTVRRFHPDYQTYGKKAPLIRNTEMVKEATRAVIFYDGSSPGTKDTIAKVKRRKIPHKVVLF